MAANLELQLTARYEICLIIIFIGLPGSELSKSTMGSTKKQLYSVVVKRFLVFTILSVVQAMSPGDSSTPCTPHLEALAGHANNFQVTNLFIVV
jgi:hypothetical protein